MAIPKRFVFMVTSFSLAGGLLFFKYLSYEEHLKLAIFLGVASLIFSAFALRYDLAGVEYFTLLSLPVTLCVSTAFILSLLPKDSPLWYLIFFTFPILFYIALLSENIFNVAAIRTIPLLTAAHTAAFLVTIITAFLSFTAIYKPALEVWQQLLLVFLISFILHLQYVWSLTLQERIKIAYIISSFTTAILQLELAGALIFIPLKSFFRALILSTAFYISLGSVRHYFKKDLSLRVVVEYIVVGGVVVGVLLLL